jgi:hypothetical protein
VVSAAILILAGSTAVGALLLVPALIFWNATRNPGLSRFYTAITLLLWACASIVIACVWFLIVVAAHHVNSDDLNFWIAANVIYPAIGAVIVCVHRWMARHSSSG